VTPFGATADGHPVELFTLTSPTGIEIRTISYGAILVSISTPDRSGRIADIALGFDSLDGYLTRSRYFGAVVGRYGNRLPAAGSRSTDRTIQLATNSGTNHIHGGVKGSTRCCGAASRSPATARSASRSAIPVRR
jgi:aldose 1-epimerase